MILKPDNHRDIRDIVYDVDGKIIEVIIPNSVVYIRYDYFCGCESLKSIVIRSYFILNST